MLVGSTAGEELGGAFGGSTTGGAAGGGSGVGTTTAAGGALGEAGGGVADSVVAGGVPVHSETVSFSARCHIAEATAPITARPISPLERGVSVTIALSLGGWGSNAILVGEALQLLTGLLDLGQLECGLCFCGAQRPFKLRCFFNGSLLFAGDQSFKIRNLFADGADRLFCTRIHFADARLRLGFKCL